jgi:hypothetical protein
MTELVRCTEIMQRGPGEELASPFLENSRQIEGG